MSSCNIVQSISLTHLPQISKFQPPLCSISLGFLCNVTLYEFWCDFTIWSLGEAGRMRISRQFDIHNVLHLPRDAIRDLSSLFSFTELDFNMVIELFFSFLPSRWYRFYRGIQQGLLPCQRAHQIEFRVLLPMESENIEP